MSLNAVNENLKTCNSTFFLNYNENCWNMPSHDITDNVSAEKQNKSVAVSAINTKYYVQYYITHGAYSEIVL